MSFNCAWFKIALHSNSFTVYQEGVRIQYTVSFNHRTIYLLMSTNNCLCRNPVWLDDRAGLLGSHSRLTRLARYLLRVGSHRPLLGGAVDDARRQQSGGSHLHLSEGAVVCSALTSYHCSRQCCEYRYNVPYKYDE